jgi:hypothetical protein
MNSSAAIQKSRLVDLGQYALSHGHWQMVLALTRIIAERGLSDA